MRTVGSSYITRKNDELITQVFLYEILYDENTNSFLRWTSLPGGVTYEGQAWATYPVIHDTIQEDATGKAQRTRLIVSNAERQIQTLIDAFDGFRNKKVRIIQTWAETLADPDAFVSDELTIREALINERTVDFLLADEFDVLDVRVPKRTVAEAVGGTEAELRFGGFSATPSQNLTRETG